MLLRKHGKVLEINDNSIYNTIQYNKIQYRNEYYYSGINPVEFRGRYDTHETMQMTQELHRLEGVGEELGLRSGCDDDVKHLSPVTPEHASHALVSVMMMMMMMMMMMRMMMVMMMKMMMRMMMVMMMMMMMRMMMVMMIRMMIMMMKMMTRMMMTMSRIMGRSYIMHILKHIIDIF